MVNLISGSLKKVKENKSLHWKRLYQIRRSASVNFTVQLAIRYGLIITVNLVLVKIVRFRLLKSSLPLDLHF